MMRTATPDRGEVVKPGMTAISGASQRQQKKKRNSGQVSLGAVGTHGALSSHQTTVCVTSNRVSSKMLASSTAAVEQRLAPRLKRENLLVKLRDAHVRVRRRFRYTSRSSTAKDSELVYSRTVRRLGLRRLSVADSAASLVSLAQAASRRTDEQSGHAAPAARGRLERRRGARGDAIANRPRTARFEPPILFAEAGDAFRSVPLCGRHGTRSPTGPARLQCLGVGGGPWNEPWGVRDPGYGCANAQCQAEDRGSVTNWRAGAGRKKSERAGRVLPK